MALTISLTPGYVFQENELITADKLNLLGNPTLDLEGGVSSISVADGSITRPKLADGCLSADAPGRAKMANGFLSADVTGRQKMGAGYVNTALLADGALSNDTTGRAKMADGFLSADTAGRAKMANGYITAAHLGAGIVFTSANTALPAGQGVISLAHGFTGIPKIVRWVLVCIGPTADGNYAVGDEIGVEGIGQTGGTPVRNCQSGADGINVFLLFATGTFAALNKTTGAPQTLTVAKWNAKCYASMV